MRIARFQMGKIIKIGAMFGARGFLASKWAKFQDGVALSIRGFLISSGKLFKME